MHASILLTFITASPPDNYTYLYLCTHRTEPKLSFFVPERDVVNDVKHQSENTDRPLVEGLTLLMLSDVLDFLFCHFGLKCHTPFTLSKQLHVGDLTVLHLDSWVVFWTADWSTGLGPINQQVFDPQSP